MITRIEKLLGNLRFAGFFGCLISAVVFGASHWYQGAVGMLITGTLGLAFGVVFLWQGRNLWANMAAHILANTIGLSFTSLNLGQAAGCLWTQLVWILEGLRYYRVQYWEIIADNLSKADWSWGCVAAMDSRPRAARL
jgi:membrane protease YdiL (CAAX protease family)